MGEQLARTACQAARAWRSFLSLLAFDSPKAIAVDISALLSGLAIVPSSWLQGPSLCLFKRVIFPLVLGSCPATGLIAGCNCPACGMTRGLIRMLHLDWRGAVAYNRLSPVVFALLLAMLAISTVQLARNRASGSR